MNVTVSKQKEYILYFDIEGDNGVNNLELPEKERFGAVLILPSYLQSQKAKESTIENGEIKTDINYEKYIKIHVKKLLNPPTISGEGLNSKKISIDDIFNYTELEKISVELLNKIADIRDIGIKKK